MKNNKGAVKKPLIKKRQNRHLPELAFFCMNLPVSVHACTFSQKNGTLNKPQPITLKLKPLSFAADFCCDIYKDGIHMKSM